MVVTFSTGTKQADFLGIFLNLMEKKNLFCKWWYDFRFSPEWYIKFHYLPIFWVLKIKKKQLLMGLKVDIEHSDSAITVE